MADVCDEDIEYLSRYNGNQNPYGPLERQINGLKNVINFFHSFSLSAPDIVPVIYEAPQGHSDPDTGESMIVFKVLASMTKTSLVVELGELTEAESSSANRIVSLQGKLMLSMPCVA